MSLYTGQKTNKINMGIKKTFEEVLEAIYARGYKEGYRAGLSKEGKIEKDLYKDWSWMAEPIQNILRREGYPKPYEKLKDLTRNHEYLSKEQMHDFIKGLDIKESVKKEMMAITPESYVGLK